jgi:hypothetical protein
MCTLSEATTTDVTSTTPCSSWLPRR